MHRHCPGARRLWNARRNQGTCGDEVTADSDLEMAPGWAGKIPLDLTVDLENECSVHKRIKADAHRRAKLAINGDHVAALLFTNPEIFQASLPVIFGKTQA